MYLPNKHLHRRTFLRGMGAAIALPALDSMIPARASTAGAAPMRLVFTYIPIGAIMKDWTPEGTGKDYKFSRILKPLEGNRDDITIIGGLNHLQAMPSPGAEGGGAHARAGSTYLTGVRAKRTGGSDIRAGVSVDQIVARKTGQETRFASLELGCDDTRLVGACDSGCSCAYQNTICWRTETSPLPMETNPRVIFERLFGTDDLILNPEDRARRLKARKSILDLVQGETQSLMGKLGPTDKRKVDEYLFAVRGIEKQIEANEKEHAQTVPTIEKPAGVPPLFTDYLKLMFNLQILAMQGDMTRVITFMFGREASQRTYEEIGIPDPHHPLTHHRGNKEWIEKVTRINVYHAQHFAWFLNRLKTTPDGDGSLLDHMMVIYGSGISDGNDHSKLNLPTILAGRANGAFQHGRHVVYPEKTPMTNLWLTLLDRMGVHPESVGDSTGRLEHLTDL